MTAESSTDNSRPNLQDHATVEHAPLQRQHDESRQRFHAIFENARDPILLMDDSGRFVDGNSVACDWLGCRREALTQLTLRDVAPRENQTDISTILHGFLSAGNDIGQFFVMCKDGVTKEVELRAVANILPGLHLGILRDITDRNRADAALRKQATPQEVSVRRTIEIQEQEKRLLARKLNDDIAQVLNAVSIHLRAAKDVGNDACTVKLEDCIRIVDQTIQQVCNLSLELRPLMLDDLGLVSTLRWYADRQARASGLELHFVADSAGTQLPSDLEIACFRVTQEALRNVLLHAQAKHVWLDFHQNEHAVRLLIRDDGIGFETSIIRPSPASEMTTGLIGIQERVELLGGKLYIHSRIGIGVTIEAWLPISPSTTWSSAKK